MANPTSTLNQTQPEKKTARNLALGLMEDTFEILTGRADSGFVNEGSVIPEILDPKRGWQVIKPEARTDAGRLAIGGQTEMLFNNPDQVRLKEVQWRIQRVAETNQEIIGAETRIELERNARSEVAGMSQDERNTRLHLSKDYAKKNTQTAYHEALLYAQLKEDYRRAENQKKEQPIASPAKQPSAMEGIFEGRSGSQGGGTANLSVQAVG